MDLRSAPLRPRPGDLRRSHRLGARGALGARRARPAHRSVRSHAGGELEADLEVILEPIAGGRARYTKRMRIRAIPAFRPLGWLVERTVMKRKMQRDFERMILPNYKRTAEQHAAS